MSAQTTPTVIGSGHAEQILALAGAVDAITEAIDFQVDLVPDRLRAEIRGIHHLLTTTSAEIRERVNDWLAVEQMIADGAAERCHCGDVLPPERMPSHLTRFHPEEVAR